MVKKMVVNTSHDGHMCDIYKICVDKNCWWYEIKGVKMFLKNESKNRKKGCCGVEEVAMIVMVAVVAIIQEWGRK